MCISKRYLFIITALIYCLPANAQKKQYTMAEATNGIVTNLAPQGIKQAAWIPGTHTFWQSVKINNTQKWVLMNMHTGRADTFSTTPENGHNRLAAYNWLQKNSFYGLNAAGDSLFVSGNEEDAMDRGGWIKLPKGASNIVVDKNRKAVAYNRDNNLWMVSLENRKKAIPLTMDTNRNIISGQSVHRNEFGIDNGIFFSPKGNYLAYYRMDQTMVADYPVIDWSVTPATVEHVKYPMAGGVSHQVTVRVYNPATRQTVELQTGEGKDHYLTCVTWSPDERFIYIALLNRAQNHLWLNQYSAKTGEKIKTLFEETDPKYVEPQHPLSFLPGSNDQFVWWSQRDGYMHLYLYHTSGKLLKQLTKGPWIVNELLAFNKDRQEILFSASKESPLEKHGYAVNWKTDDWYRIDQEPGTHNFTASDDGAYVFDVLTAKGVAKKSMIRATDGSMTKVLLDAPNPLAGYERPRMKDIKLKAIDGTRLYGKLILPTHFDSTKKYPVIVYLYNGPHVQLVKNGFPESGNLWYEYLAQHGYIVWTMDGRGSSNRGLAFENVTFRRLGTVEMQDQLTGVDYLQSLPYVDAKRMGVHGWSFGGFMTTSLMLRHPGIFKCAVAGGPVMDWKMYEIMYGERYMDTPQENPEGYEAANLLTKVKDLKGKLLLIHGAQDATVVWQHSINFIKKSVDENVQVDYFVYPGYEHNVRGKDRVHLMQKITDYFDQNL